MSTLTPNLKNASAQFEAYLSNTRLRSQRTVQSYLAVVRALAVHATDGRLLELSAGDLTGFLGRGGSASTRSARVRWNLELSALRALYRWAVDAGIRADDPSAGIARHRVAQLEAEPLSLEEMVRLVETARTDSPATQRERNVALLQIFLHTALRVAEVVSLNVDQVDPKAHVIHAVRRKGGKVTPAPMNDVVAEAIEEYLDVRGVSGGSAGQRALFLSQHDGRLSVRTVQQLVAAYAKKAGITRRVSPHTLRHSSATQLAALGTPIRVIQEICAHSSVVTTQRYVHTAARDRLEAVDRLARAFRSQESRGAAPPQ